MNDDNDNNEDERTEEISSIQSIYPELVVDPSDPYTLTLELSVTPIQPLTIFFKPAAESAPPTLSPPTLVNGQEQHLPPPVPRLQPPGQYESHQLSHLPPLSLRLQLPAGYPTTKPPIVSILCESSWLPQKILNRLLEDYSNKWEEYGREPVIFGLIADLKTEAEDAFGLANDGEIYLSTDLQLALLDFDLKTKREEFQKETFDCGICLEPKKGIQCHKMVSCGHVFCVPCLQDFYRSCITEGDVDNVKCLSPDCGKDEQAVQSRKRRKQDPTLNPSELLQIPLEQELVQRYVHLKRKKRLEADKNTIYCPREWCQGAAKSKKHPKPVDLMNDQDSSYESDNEEADPTKVSSQPLDLEALPMSQRLSVCEDCNFAFCCVCRKGWHGELARCSPRRAKEITEEEAASLAYLNKYSTPCPTCNVRAQKIVGCNHMKCFQCKTHFCYLCSAFLMEDNPYRHFNDIDSPCYQRLWVLEAGDGEGVDVGAHYNLDGLAENWEEAADADDIIIGVEDEVPPQNGRVVNGLRQFADEDEEDSSDEEPAPDVRRHERNMHIEFVNFAGPNGQNAQRVALPERPRVPIAIVPAGPPPPPAPNPPGANRRRRRGQANQGNRHPPPAANGGAPRRNQQAQQAARVQNARPRPNQQQQPLDRNGGDNLNAVAAVVVQNAHPTPDVVEPAAPGHLPLAAPGQGNNPNFAQGLERFLRLAEADQEDEWDSDELDEDDFNHVEHMMEGFGGWQAVEPQPRRRGRDWV